MTTDLSILLDTARANGWCTRLFCTTCGSHEFLSELNKIDCQVLVSQLRELDESYFLNRYPILLIIYRAAVLPYARDLLEPLGDSPAGRFLQKAIALQTQRDENRRLQEEMATPEAVAERKAARKLNKQTMREQRRVDKMPNKEKTP